MDITWLSGYNLHDGSFPRKKNLEIKNFDKPQLLVEKFTTRVLSAPCKKGIQELEENYAPVILGFMKCTQGGCVMLWNLKSNKLNFLILHMDMLMRSCGYNIHYERRNHKTSWSVWDCSLSTRYKPPWMGTPSWGYIGVPNLVLT